MAEELLSLPECSARLKAAMGAQAPALVTLKRWSSDGKLKKAKVEARNGRHRYRFEVVRLVAMSAVQESTSTHAKRDRIRSAEKAGVASTDTAGANPLILHADDLESLKAYLGGLMQDSMRVMLRDLKAALEEKAISGAVSGAVETAMGRISTQLTDGLKTLEATRVSMMLKYDSVDALRRDKVDTLTEERDRLRKDATSLDAHKVAATLSQMMDILRSLAARP